MALYFYEGLSREGKKKRGTVDASSTAEVRDQLSRQGFYPTTIMLASERQKGFSLSDLFRRSVSLKSKIFFTKQLAVLLKSGVPLMQSLELLTEQTEGALRGVVIDLKDTIKEGKGLADGMQRYPKIFDITYIQLVRAGEASGKLEIILERLTDYLERRAELSSKISGALMMPAIQLVVIFLVVVVLLTMVVPQITQIFESQTAELPFATSLLMSISEIAQKYYLLIGGGLFGLYVLFHLWKSTKRGRQIFDQIKLKIPVIGYFARTGAIIQFCRTLGMLMEGGVNLSEALTIVVNVVNNAVLVDVLSKARESIIKQGKITEYLKKTGLFPPLAIYLMNTGEQSGNLDAMLLAIAKQYEGELNEYADNLSTILSPVILLFMACIVGFIVMAIVIPIVRLSSMAG